MAYFVNSKVAKMAYSSCSLFQDKKSPTKWDLLNGWGDWDRTSEW